jgi:hypothetical protein
MMLVLRENNSLVNAEDRVQPTSRRAARGVGLSDAVHPLFLHVMTSVGVSEVGLISAIIGKLPRTPFLGSGRTHTSADWVNTTHLHASDPD